MATYNSDNARINRIRDIVLRERMPQRGSGTYSSTYVFSGSAETLFALFAGSAEILFAVFVGSGLQNPANKAVC